MAEAVELRQIKGERAQSSLEAMVATSLDKFGWDYQYQVGFFGGRRTRGGFIIDFIVETLPLPTPLFVHGQYWHGSKEQERDRIQMVLLTSTFGGQINQPVVLFGIDLPDQDACDQAILKEFGRRQ